MVAARIVRFSAVVEFIEVPACTRADSVEFLETSPVTNGQDCQESDLDGTCCSAEAFCAFVGRVETRRRQRSVGATVKDTLDSQFLVLPQRSLLWQRRKSIRTYPEGLEVTRESGSHPR